jgi:putative DNA methylase
MQFRESPEARQREHDFATTAQAPVRAPVVELTLLERGFPFRELSILTNADRRGRDPIYAVHRWWARRPPALVRGVLLAALARPSGRLGHFWRKFADASDHLSGKRVHDPFLGGGSTVVEASRLGAVTSGTDVDPLACMIARHEAAWLDPAVLGEHGNRLAKFLCERVANLYQTKAHKWTPLHWFWIHIVTCPGCHTKAALYRNLVIARDAKKVGAVVRDSAQTVFCPKCFKIHHLKSLSTKRFVCCGTRDIRQSTFKNLKFHCPTCGSRSGHSALKTLTATRRLLAVEETHPQKRRRIRGPNTNDRKCLRLSDSFVASNADTLAIPSGSFAMPRRDLRPMSYGASAYADLFHPRQLAIFGLAFAWIRDCDAPPLVKESLMLATSHALAFNNRLCGYATDYGRLSALFSVRSYSLPALSVELNPLHPSAGRGTLLKLLRVRLLESRTIVRRTTWDERTSQARMQDFEFKQAEASEIRCASALADYPPHDRIDFSFFDPPYFDYISYSELSEFYRPWLSLDQMGGTPMLPHDSDPVGSFAAALASAIKLLRARLKPNVPFAFTFHSTSPDAWEAVAKALTAADERITAIWPVLADPHMGHHGVDGACEWDLLIVCRPALVCRRKRKPSIGRWQRALRPLVVRPTDQAAFATAVNALGGLFGSIVRSRPAASGGNEHEG